MKIWLAALVVLITSLPAIAQDTSDGFTVSSASMTRNGDLMTVKMDLNFQDFKVKSTQGSVFIPMIVNGTDTLMLPSVGLYGRTRWYQTERANAQPLGGGEGISLRYNKNLENFNYVENVNYAEWMNGATLQVLHTDYGCANCKGEEDIHDYLAQYQAVRYVPQFIFQEAVAEEIKTRELSGRAFVDFKVNQIVIYPDYRRNSYELGKIIATIDSVKNDKDITVTSLSIKGTASPEGPYDNNIRLAKGRTAALTEYVRNLYNFPKDFIKQSYEPVDWEGLIEWLENNNLEHKDAILAIAKGNLPPEQRNSKIQTTYPSEYKWLLENVYPALRHSDYRIEYSIRQFSNVEEIAEVIKTAPQKLSLNEMYLLAGSLEPGSDDYNEVFETAVRMYPNDETANLNAANSALMRNDFAKAEKYLAKAGTTPKAIYARGVLEALKGNYAEAVSLIEKAVGAGLTEAQPTLENLRESAKYTN